MRYLLALENRSRFRGVPPHVSSAIIPADRSMYHNLKSSITHAEDVPNHPSFLAHELLLIASHHHKVKPGAVFDVCYGLHSRWRQLGARYVPDIVIVLWFVVHEICVSCYISKTSSCSALFRRVYVPMTGIFGVALVTATLFALRSSTTSVCVGVASRLPGNCASEETSTPTALSCSAVSSSLSSVICNTALPFEHLPRNWSSLSAPSSALQSGVCSRLSS